MWLAILAVVVGVALGLLGARSVTLRLQRDAHGYEEGTRRVRQVTPFVLGFAVASFALGALIATLLDPLAGNILFAVFLTFIGSQMAVRAVRAHRAARRARNEGTEV